MSFLRLTQRLFLILLLSSVLVTLFLLLFSIFSGARPSYPDDSILHEIMDKLEMTLDFVSRDYRKVSMECLIYIAIAEGVLDDTLWTRYDKQFENYKAKFRNVREKVKARIKKSPYWYYIKEIVTPKFWRNQKRFRHKFRSLKNQNFGAQTQNFQNMTPAVCLSDIFENTIIFGNDKFCFINENCINYLQDIDTTSKTNLLQKLFLLIIFQRNKCSESFLPATKLTETICYNLLPKPTRNPNFVDTLPQHVFCSFQGFLDYFHMNYLGEFLKFDTQEGCFGARGDECDHEHPCMVIAILSIYLNYFINIRLI